MVTPDGLYAGAAVQLHTYLLGLVLKVLEVLVSPLSHFSVMVYWDKQDMAVIPTNVVRR